jgi:hypothetical protein
VRRGTLAGLFCALALACGPAAGAPFGTLVSPEQTPNFGPSGLLARPEIAKWLMTLPQPSDWPEPNVGDVARAALLDPTPIGGEPFQLSAAVPSTAPMQLAEASVSRQLFDITPLGGAPYRFTNPRASTLALAESAPSAAPAEGRSVAGQHARALPRRHKPVLHPTRVANPERCICTAR